MNHTTWRLRRLTAMALLIALAYASVFFIRVPVVLFLNYEPKDVILAIGAFLFGPIAGAGMATTVALIELITISTTGMIGLIMNILSSCLFVCTASFIYHRKRTLGGAIAGLLCGTILMTCAMVLWNYLITPLYMTVPRQEIAGMLLTVFAPFNLLKGALNATLTVILYKSVSSVLRSARLLPPVDSRTNKRKSAVWIISIFVFCTLILLLLLWKGII